MVSATVFEEVTVPIEDPMAHWTGPLLAKVMEIHHVCLAVSLLPEVR